MKTSNPRPQDGSDLITLPNSVANKTCWYPGYSVLGVKKIHAILREQAKTINAQTDPELQVTDDLIDKMNQASKIAESAIFTMMFSQPKEIK